MKDNFWLRLVSYDLPRSAVLGLLVVGIAICLLFVPVLFPGARSLDTSARICGFIIVAVSYDILFGYTGIITLCHITFFGIGAYAAAISLAQFGPGWGVLLLATAAGICTAVLLATLISVFALRIRTLFFAMFTLAVAKSCEILMSQLSRFSGGDDGMTFIPPAAIAPSTTFEVFGLRIGGATLCYYLIYALTVIVFLAVLRLVNSPFGKSLQAIRDNELRAAALGIPTQRYRVVAMAISAGLAALGGSLLSLWWTYVNPATTLSPNIMIDILLMVVIGGSGTIYGPVVGVTVFVIAMNYLSEGLESLSDSIPHIPFVADLLNAERWQLWLGLLFVLTLYYFPTGIAGHLRGKKRERQAKLASLPEVTVTR